MRKNLYQFSHLECSSLACAAPIVSLCAGTHSVTYPPDLTQTKSYPANRKHPEISIKVKTNQRDNGNLYSAVRT